MIAGRKEDAGSFIHLWMSSAVITHSSSYTTSTSMIEVSSQSDTYGQAQSSDQLFCRLHQPPEGLSSNKGKQLC